VPISHKAANKFALVSVALANFVAFVAVSHWKEPGFSDWGSLVAAVSKSLPAGFGVVLVGIANAQLSANAKARVIFMRWHDPLPASRAFSVYATRDSRIDLGRLKHLFGPFPTDPKQQNAKWYGLYKSVEHDLSVAQVHREFLFTRDYGCLALFMGLVLGPLAFLSTSSRRVAIAYCTVLLVQFLLVSRAARQHGERFVTTVLALKAADK
jgi:hypothetical protein